jgi:hypothetical protein
MKLDAEAPPEGTVRDWLEARAAAGGVAFVFPETGETLTWPALRAAAVTLRGCADGPRRAEGRERRHRHRPMAATASWRFMPRSPAASARP